MNDFSVLDGPSVGWRDSDPTLNFGMVPRWVIEHRKLSATDVRVYVLIAAESWGTGRLEQIPRNWIADRLGVSRATVYRSEQRLVAAGALVTHEQFEAGGAQTGHRYELVWTEPGVAKTRGEGVTGDMGRMSPARQRGISGETETTSIDNKTSEQTQTRDDFKNEHSEGSELAERSRIAVTLARQWCRLTGAVPTGRVLGAFAEQALEYMSASGRIPTSEDLERWHSRGIRTPSGWAFTTADEADIETDWSHLDE